METCIKNNSFINSIMFAPYMAPHYDYDPQLYFFISDDHHNAICASLIHPDGHHVNAEESLDGQIAVIIYCHGNACNVYTSTSFAFNLAINLHCYVLSFDYIGYGLSQNTHSKLYANESTACLSIQLVIDHVVINMNIPPSNIILWGESIGTGIATHGAKYCMENIGYEVAALILASPYLSIKDLAQDISYFGSLVLQRINTKENIKDIHCPLFIVHGIKDQVIPVSHGKILLDMASNNYPKIGFFPSQADHHHFDFKTLFKKVNLFLDEFVRSHICLSKYINITPRTPIHGQHIFGSYIYDNISAVMATSSELSCGVAKVATSNCIIS